MSWVVALVDTESPVPEPAPTPPSHHRPLKASSFWVAASGKGLHAQCRQSFCQFISHPRAKWQNNSNSAFFLSLLYSSRNSFCASVLVLWSASNGETPTFLPFIYFLSPPLVTPLVNPVHCSWDVRYRRRRPLQTDPPAISRGVRPAHSGWLNVQLFSFFFLFSPPLATAFCLPIEFQMCAGYFHCFSRNTVEASLPGDLLYCHCFPKKGIAFYTQNKRNQ